MKARALNRGFSLLEILIALLVLSLGLLALTQAASQQAIARQAIRDQAHATWIASNALEALRLETDWPDTGVRRGQARMGFRDWYWWMEIIQTDQPRVRRVDVYVGPDATEQEPVTSISGFFGRRNG